MESSQISPRIAIYGLGFVGQQLAGFALDKAWEIVGAYNRAGEKIGQDLGSLLGRDPIGLRVEDCDTADYSRLTADIAFVSVSDRLEVNYPSYERLMSAGANILCHGASLATLAALIPALPKSCKCWRLRITSPSLAAASGI